MNLPNAEPGRWQRAISKAADVAERLFWTFVAAFSGFITASPVLITIIENMSGGSVDLDALQTVLVGAAFSGFTAVANLLNILVREYVPALPSPGEGLPGAAPA